MIYRVKWEIDVEADSPLEAAEKAEQYQKHSEGGVFEVSSMPELVDLAEVRGFEEGEDAQACSDCKIAVREDEPYFATPCGTFCEACMEKHAKECGICRSEFDLGEEEETDSEKKD